MDEHIIYITANIHVFNVIEFFKAFHFTTKADGEKVFRQCIGKMRRSGDETVSSWGKKMSKGDFSILRDAAVLNYWREVQEQQAFADAKVAGKIAVLNSITNDFVQEMPNKKRKREEVEMTTFNLNQLLLNSSAQDNFLSSFNFTSDQSPSQLR